MPNAGYQLEQLTLECERGFFTAWLALTDAEAAGLRAVPNSFLWDDYAGRVAYVVPGTEPTAEDARTASIAFAQWRPGAAARYNERLEQVGAEWDG